MARRPSRGVEVDSFQRDHFGEPLGDACGRCDDCRNGMAARAATPAARPPAAAP